jgi:hypothetical protein
MKYSRILFLAAAVSGLASCAMEEVKEYPVDKPEYLEQYEYLKEYDVLKNYVDRTASPDFKLGAGVDASKFVSHGHAVWKIEREAGSLVAEHVEPHLLADLPVVSLLGFFQHVHVGIQFLL